MTTPSTRTIGVVCNRGARTYICEGCSQRFCFNHLIEHRKNLDEQLHLIENDHDQLRQYLNVKKTYPTKYPLLKQIDQWEEDSIRQIKQTADQCREKLINQTNAFSVRTEKKLNNLAEQIKEIRQHNEFNEIDLNHLMKILYTVEEELVQPPNIFIEKRSASLLNSISVRTPWDTRWKQLAITIAGGNSPANRLDQFSYPSGICVDHDQTIYIADSGNDRIMEWKTNGRIVAGGNGEGNQINQLAGPTDIIIYRENNSLIIADYGNRRVMRWCRQTTPHGHLIISDIDCIGLTIDKDGSLYVSDCVKNEVRRWRKGETDGTIVAGGNGQGNQLNQLHYPIGIFVDDDYALYISDENNHRVMKWVKDGREGIVVAGGNGHGDHPTQVTFPYGVVVDQFGQIYVADCYNHRVMRWCEGAQEGTIVVGGNGRGQQANQLHRPTSLSFDGEGNLYVADCWNHRIQKFMID